ncbi:MAG: LysR family transcriptional regulator [Isosphaeraceae bacterium]
MGRNDRGGDPRKGRLQHLRSFCQAAQLGSISRAAEQVGLSQPSVSLQIQALEQELKVSLFQRRGPRIALTPEGQALYKLAKPMVEAVDGLPALFQACRAGQETGWLNVAAGESTILYILPEPVRRFAGLYPGVELKLHNVTGREGLKQLRGDAVDFAFGSLLEVPADMVYEPTVSYETMLITPIDHPLTKLARVRIQDIARYPLILPPPQLTTWRLVDYAFQKYKLTYRVAARSRRLGGDQAVRRHRPGHRRGHGNLPHRPGAAGGDPAVEVLSEPHLRHRAPQGQAADRPRPEADGPVPGAHPRRPERPQRACCETPLNRGRAARVDGSADQCVGCCRAPVRRTATDLVNRLAFGHLE